MKAIFPLVLGFVLLSLLSRAQALPVDNFSFELPTTPGLPSDYLILTGTTTGNWTYGSPENGGVQNIAHNGFSSDGTADGNQDAWINPNPGGTGTITSTDNFTIVAGTNYVLTVAVGLRNDGAGSGDSTLSLIDTTKSNTVIAFNPVSQAQLTAGTFSDFSATLTAAQSTLLAGDSMTIQLSEFNPTGGFVQGNFDNVRLNATSVPEPSTYAMMLVGLAFLGIGIRRRLV